MKYTVKFYHDGEYLATGHGYAEDEYEAEMKAEMWMVCNRPNTKYNRVETEVEVCTEQ